MQGARLIQSALHIQGDDLPDTFQVALSRQHVRVAGRNDLPQMYLQHIDKPALNLRMHLVRRGRRPISICLHYIAHTADIVW